MSSKHERVVALANRIRGTGAALEMLAELRRRIASYERLSPEVSEAEVLEVCKHNLRLSYRWLTSGHAPSQEDLDGIREAVRARAGEGVPLEDLLQAYRLGGQLGWQLLRRHAEPAEREALLDAADLLMTYIDLVSAVVTEAYLDERDLLVSEEERRTRNLVNRIVEGGVLEAEEMWVAERLGVPLRDAYVPFCVALPGASPQRHAALATRLRSSGRLAVTEGDRVFGLTERTPQPADLDEGPQVLLALTDETPRGQLAEARAELLLLVDHGRRSGTSGVITPESHAIELLLGRSPRVAERLRSCVLGPLLRGGDGADLVRTLETLVRCQLDRTRTCKRLHVHRNTLSYRIGRIQELTGLDLTSPRDLACTYLALAVASDAA